MKKLALLLAVTALPTISPGLAFADCPAVNALRNSLVAQNTANIQRVISTKNCALIPGVLAFVRRANATIDQAFIKADCHSIGAHTSTAQLETMLRNACDPSHSKSTGQTATALPSAETASTPKKPAAKEAKAAPPTAAPAPKPAAQQQPAAPPSNPSQQQSANCNTITGLGGGYSGPSNCQTSTGVPPNVQAQINETRPNQTPTIKSPPNTSPPSKGEALESLRDLMPDLGRLLDATADAVNSPNIPPPDQWTNVSTPPSTANPSRRSEPTPSQNDQANAPTTTADATPEQASPVQDSPDDDYAAICKSESVKNGLKSLTVR
jgi:hypothetical protein